MVLTRLFLDLLADMEMLIEEKPENDVISAFFWTILLALTLSTSLVLSKGG